MEESKAAEYHDELSRRGEGAARFKHGLGFSSGDDNSNSFQKPSSSCSLFSNFVKASSPDKAEKQEQLSAVQRKLGKKDDAVSRSRDGDRRRRERSRSPDEKWRRSRSRDRRSRSPARDSRRKRSPERDTRRRRSVERDSRKSRSPVRDSRRKRLPERDSRRRQSVEKDSRKSRSPVRDSRRNRSPERTSRRRASLERDSRRSRSPERDSRRSEKTRSKNGKGGASTDYAQLIEGYSQMTPAERVKAKMKLQLSRTAANDTAMGMKSGWERFDFNKDAPLDDEEMEVAEDDVSLVKDIGRSFRFSAVQTKREDEIKAAHDHAMFGAPLVPEDSKRVESEHPEKEPTVAEDDEKQSNAALVSDKVLSMQQGSWRDRVRKVSD